MGDQSGSEQQPTAAAGVPSMDSVQTLKFPPPSVFDGSEDKFEDFEFKLKGYMSLSNVKFRKAMNAARDSDEPIDYDLFHSDGKAMAIQLQNALVALCSGPALQLIRDMAKIASRHGGNCVHDSRLRSDPEQRDE